MRTRIVPVLLVVVATLLSAPALRAGEGGRPRKPRDPRLALLDRLIEELPKFLSPEEARTVTAAVRKLKAEWRSLSPEERNRRLADLPEPARKSYRRIARENRVKRNRKRWDQLPRKEREKLLARHRRLQEILKGKTPGEREEILEKLRRIGDLRRLREKQERLRRVEGRFRAELPPTYRKRLDALAPRRREALLRHAMARMADLFRHRLTEGLTAQDRARLDRLRGPARFRELMKIKASQALAKLPPEERERIRALPPREKAERIRHLMQRLHAAARDRVRHVVAEEIAKLLGLPPKDLDRRLRQARRPPPRRR